MILGVPDGIWGTGTHLALIAAVTAVALATTVAAAMISTLRPSGQGRTSISQHLLHAGPGLAAALNEV